MDTLEPRPIASDVQVKIENALKRNAQIDASQIAVRIEGTRVMLTGKVRSWLEREEAEDAAFAAPGVIGVDNRITIQ